MSRLATRDTLVCRGTALLGSLHNTRRSPIKDNGRVTDAASGRTDCPTPPHDAARRPQTGPTAQRIDTAVVGWGSGQADRSGTAMPHAVGEPRRTSGV